MGCPNLIRHTECMLELSRKHNELLTAIRRVNTEHNLLVPFSLLPIELIRQIFLLCSFPFDTIRHISQVCCLWRNIAIHFPALWSELPRIGRINSFWLEEILSRSKEHPLTVSIFPYSVDEEMPTRDGLIIVLRHAHRISNFSYRSTLTTTLDHVNLELIKAAFKRGTPLLSVLDVRPKNYVSWEFPFSECPNLRELQIDQGTSLLNPEFLPNLTSLKVDRGEEEYELTTSIVDWIMTMAKLPSLQTLVIGDIFSRKVVPTEHNLQGLPLVNLPNLSFLDIIGPLDNVEPILNHLIIPSTSSLDLVIMDVSKSNSHLRSLRSMSSIMSRLSDGTVAYPNWNIQMSSINVYLSNASSRAVSDNRPIISIEFVWWGPEARSTNVEMFKNVFGVFDFICSEAKVLSISAQDNLQKSMKRALPYLISAFASIDTISLDKHEMSIILPILYWKDSAPVMLPNLKWICPSGLSTQMDGELEAFLAWRERMGYSVDLYFTTTDIDRERE